MWTSSKHYLAYISTRLLVDLSACLPRPLIKYIILRALRISKYRRSTVIANLQASFPNLTTDELTKISNEYYEHLVDVTLDQLRSNDKQDVVAFEDTEVIQKLLLAHGTLIVLGSHYGYWETVGKAITKYIPTKHQYVAYKRLRNQFLDGYMRKLRSDTVAKPIEQKKIYRQILQDIESCKKSAYYLIADQYPSSLQNMETLTFLNQETRWINSAKKIAQKYSLPVIYLQWNTHVNDQHTVKIVVIHEPGSSSEGIIETYAKCLEQQIATDPSKWLWSHKRWKNIREN